MAASSSGRTVLGNLQTNSNTVDGLRGFLRKRKICHSKYNKTGLKKVVETAQKFNLDEKPSDEQNVLSVKLETSKLLSIEGGLISLPNPDELNEKWGRTALNFPHVTTEAVNRYITKCSENLGITTGGKKAKKEGQSVEEAQHVREVEYNPISANVNYCFVRAKCIPQMSTSKQPYKCWIVVHKVTGSIESSFCSCRAGLRGNCKHVVALLCYILKKIQAGENIACTSKPQIWHAPKKGQKTHQPSFARDLKVIKIAGDLKFDRTEEEKIKENRSTFDPRPPADRKPKPLSQMNLERLEEVTNGNCGLLIYARPKQRDDIIEIQNEGICLEDYLPITVEKAKLNSSCSADLYVNLCTTQEQINLLTESTKNQSDSTLWHEQRRGRITASVAGECASKVDDNLQVHRRCASTIASIMGYYPEAHSSSLEWGKKHEKAAQSKFVFEEKKNHQNLVVQSCGLNLSVHKPYLGASPDGIVVCNCCEKSCLEIKNPYKHRAKTVRDYALEKGACLKVTHVLHLDHDHPYYAQVQVQMYVTDIKHAQFVLKTVSKTDNYYHEVITFDSEFMRILLAKLDAFYDQAVVPELFSRKVKRDMILKDVHYILDSIIDKAVILREE